MSDEPSNKPLSVDDILRYIAPTKEQQIAAFIASGQMGIEITGRDLKPFLYNSDVLHKGLICRPEPIFTRVYEDNGTVRVLIKRGRLYMVNKEVFSAYDRTSTNE